MTDRALESASSFLGGRPWMLADERHHLCSLCEQPLHLLVQLDIERLPAPAFHQTSGLFQLFYCIDCEEAWMPFSACHVLRVIPAASASPGGPGVELLRRPISGWAEVRDFPTFQEGAERLFEGVFADMDFPDEDPCVEGHKLGGWPFWVQGVEYPSCPTCGEEMRYVLQLDSQRPFEGLFGDAGCGHVTQCPNHPEVMAFTWACC